MIQNQSRTVGNPNQFYQMPFLQKLQAYKFMNIKTSLTLLLLLFAITLTSCEKESFQIASTESELNLQAKIGHVLPDMQCGTSSHDSIRGTNGVVLGTVEILNSENNIHILITMNTGFFLESVFANFGESSNIPVNNNTMVLEDFMFQDYIEEGATEYTVVYPTNALPACNDIVLYANVAERNWFGQTISTQDSWIGTNVFADGFFNKYCLESCN